MHDSRPIGIFDSGIGGLTVIKEIHRLLPNESTIYVGDTARVPYGNRSPDTVTQFSQEIANFLIKENVKALVIACATASSVALKSLQQKFSSLPIIGVINPTAHDVVASTPPNTHPHMCIIGTRTTIQSKSFETAITTEAQSKKIAISTSAIACPLFVPLIEEGISSGAMLNQTISHYLSPLKNNAPSHIILGCTHYPLIAASIQTYLPDAKVINPGVATANALKKLIQENQLENNKLPTTHTYYATDITPTLNQQAQYFLGHPVSFTLTQL
jgi:glutamate racemase